MASKLDELVLGLFKSDLTESGRCDMHHAEGEDASLRILHVQSLQNYNAPW
jgi:hypothetical protein